ncbi:MAG: helix-turn-helix domain-containing protein [Pirellulales bacterium]
MPPKLHTLEEAAESLGIAPEELNELRESGKIAGVRVGTSWKFKDQEIERYAEERASGSGLGFADDDSGTIDLSPPSTDDDAGKSDVVLLSEFELGESNPDTSSTIIGKVRGVSPAESDLKIGGSQIGKKGDSNVEISLGDSSTSGDGGSAGSGLSSLPSVGGSDDDLDLVDLSIDETRSSSALPSGVGGSSVLMGGPDASGRGSNVLGPSTPLGNVGGGSSAGSGIGMASDMVELGDDLQIGSSVKGTATPSGIKSGSGIELGSGAFDDDDLVLGSLSGSDVTLNPSESGISLADPSDSGLSLEEPLELGSESGNLNELAPEDTFELTPTADAGDDDSSGSQVIALDSEAEFDENAATMLGPDQGAGMQQAPGFDAFGGGMEAMPDFAAAGGMPGMSSPGMMGGQGMAPGMAPGMMPPGMAPGMAGMAPGMMPGGMAGPAVVSAPYSIWNVMSLFGCMLILTLTGIMMFDLIAHIWSWDSGYSSLGSGLMDSIAGLFEATK